MYSTINKRSILPDRAAHVYRKDSTDRRRYWQAFRGVSIEHSSQMNETLDDESIFSYSSKKNGIFHNQLLALIVEFTFNHMLVTQSSI
jgi:hypothetical protein